MSMDKKKEVLAREVYDEMGNLLHHIHTQRMSEHDCEIRVAEDCATICLLIMLGYIEFKPGESSESNKNAGNELERD